MANPRGNPQNLIPFSATENRERTVEIAKIGGAASVKSRRARKSFKEDIKTALNSRIQPSHAKYAEIKRMLRSYGLLDEGDPTNQLLVIAGMLQRAQRDPAAAAFLRDTIGEKPKDEVDVAVNAPPIVIGIHDPGFIEAERRRQDQMLKDMGACEVVDVEAEDEPTDAEPTPLPTSDEAEIPSVENEAQPPTPEIATDEQKNCTSEATEPQQPSAATTIPPSPQQTAEKPPVDAPKPQGGGRSPDKQKANVEQPGASAPQPAKKPMTRAEAVAAMEAERRAKGVNAEPSHTPVKPVFLPSGFGRRR